MLAIFLYRHALLRIPQVSFDSHEWQRDEYLNTYRRFEPTTRQRMIWDVITNILPSKTRNEIQSHLGESLTHGGMRRYDDEDLRVRVKDDVGNWKPFPHGTRPLSR
jgi:hypothetical protein